MYRVPVFLALLFSVAAAPALAQEAAPLRDQWSEEFGSGIKLGWGHVRLTPTPAGGYRVVRRAWQPISATQRVETRLEVDTDGAGRIERYVLVAVQPLGKTTRAATRKGEALHWTVRVRAQPPLTGQVAEPVHDPDVLAYLHATGSRRPGTHTLNVLQLPTGAQSLTYRITKTKTGIRWDDEDRAWYDPEGKLLRGTDPRAPGAETVPVATAALATDMSRRPRTPAPAHLTEAELRLTRPKGLGWSLQRTPQAQLDVLALAHPQEVVLLTIPLPADLPVAEAPRRAAAERLLEQLNQAGPKRWFTFKLARLETFADRPAVALTVGGSVGGIPSGGQAWLVAGFAPRRAWLVVAAAPVDVVTTDAGKALLAVARKAVRLSAPKQQLVQVKGLGLSYTVPADWLPIPGRRGSRARPDRAGQLHLARVPLPKGSSLEALQRETLARIRRLIPDAKITAQGSGTLGGAAGRRVVIEGHVPRGGRSTAARVVAWLVPRSDGSAVQVSVIGLAINGFDLASIDAILRSVQWAEAG